MFAELPQTLQQEVLFHLNHEDFVKAKAIHDAWKLSKTPVSPSDSTDKNL